MKEWDATDAHFTPVPVALQPLQSLARSGVEARVILDLCAGAGSLSLAARMVWPRAEIIAVEVRPEERPHLRRWCDRVLIADALALDLTLAGLRPDLLLSNPPYRKALPLTTLSLRLRAARTLLLHRSTFGSHADAYDFLSRHAPAYELTIGGRPQWRLRESPDKVPHFWHLWGPRGSEWRRRLQPRLPRTLLTWRERPGTDITPPPLLPDEFLLPLPEVV